MSSRNKPNGHGALLAKSGGAIGAAGAMISSSGMGRAASVDASELSVANATASTAAAGAEREAYAEVAPAQGEGERARTRESASQPHGNKSGKPAKNASAKRRPRPGLEPLPIDGEAFVDAVHAQVDLVHLEVDLLRSGDEKIVQRELAYLRELRYGKRAPVADDDAPQIIVDMPGSRGGYTP